MKIGIIGTGRMGKTCAKRFAQLGHEIFLGSRDKAHGEQVAAEVGHGVRGGDQATAAAQSDILLFAFPWYALIDVARVVGKLEGKIIIDCINPLTSSGSLALGHKRSAAEEIAMTFPLARPVKAFNHFYVDHFENPLFNGEKASAFYCSNHDDAKAAVSQLAQELGFEPVDIGPLKHARYLEPLAAMWIQMAFHLGMGSNFALKIVSRD